MKNIKKIVLNDEPQENGNDVKDEGGLRLPPTGSGSGGGTYIDYYTATTNLGSVTVWINPFSWEGSGSGSAKFRVKKNQAGVHLSCELIQTSFTVHFTGNVHTVHNNEENSDVTYTSNDVDMSVQIDNPMGAGNMDVVQYYFENRPFSGTIITRYSDGRVETTSYSENKTVVVSFRLEVIGGQYTATNGNITVL